MKHPCFLRTLPLLSSTDSTTCSTRMDDLSFVIICDNAKSHGCFPPQKKRNSDCIGRSVSNVSASSHGSSSTSSTSSSSSSLGVSRWQTNPCVPSTTTTTTTTQLPPPAPTTSDDEDNEPIMSPLSASRWESCRCASSSSSSHGGDALPSLSAASRQSIPQKPKRTISRDGLTMPTRRTSNKGRSVSGFMRKDTESSTEDPAATDTSATADTHSHSSSCSHTHHDHNNHKIANRQCTPPIMPRRQRQPRNNTATPTTATTALKIIDQVLEETAELTATVVEVDTQ